MWLPKPLGPTPAVTQSRVRLHKAGRRLEPNRAASGTWLPVICRAAPLPHFTAAC